MAQVALETADRIQVLRGPRVLVGFGGEPGQGGRDPVGELDRLLRRQLRTGLAANDAGPRPAGRSGQAQVPGEFRKAGVERRKPVCARRRPSSPTMRSSAVGRYFTSCDFTTPTASRSSFVDSRRGPSSTMSSEPHRRVRSAIARLDLGHARVDLGVERFRPRVRGWRRDETTARCRDVVERGRRREDAPRDFDGLDPGGAVAAHDARRPRREYAGHGFDAALDPRPRFDPADAVDEQRRLGRDRAARGRKRSPLGRRGIRSRSAEPWGFR